MNLHTNLKHISCLAAAVAMLSVASPALASGPGGGGGSASGGSTTVVAPTSLSASLSGVDGATGTINVVQSPRIALSGDVVDAGLTNGTWLDLLLDNNYIQSEPVIAGRAIFIVERLPGRLGNLVTPSLQLLGALHSGSSALVRVSTTTTPLGVVGTVPLSPLAGQVVATGSFR